MKQFIRYLYEYGQGKRIRNVGFVKAEQSDRESTIHIHGKGLRLMRGDSLKVYLIFEENRQVTGIMQGEIAYMGPSINYRLNYTSDDTGTQENYDKIGGILLENRDRRRFAALWEDGLEDVENMQPYTASGSEEVPPGEEAFDTVMRDEADAPVSVEEMPDTAAENMPDAGEREMRDAAAEDIPEMPDAAAEDIPEMPDTAAGDILEMPDTAVRDEGEAADEEVQVHMQGQEDTASGLIKVTKIKRNEISRLPRCEWRLANNNFLLHGYYNYRYLVLLDDGRVLRLGVPGIYHEKEARAAAGLGFPEFIGADETVLADDEECREEPKFGFWCRQVRCPAR